jgi:predicted PurR-regulated permease PerM
MGNIIEPRFVGNKLNLSPLLIILALGFWWYIWGVVGMLLSVPIMVIMNIILSKFEPTRPIAVLFSEKWDLKIENEESEQNRKALVNKIKKRLFF